MKKDGLLTVGTVEKRADLLPLEGDQFTSSFGRSRHSRHIPLPRFCSHSHTTTTIAMPAPVVYVAGGAVIFTVVAVIVFKEVRFRARARIPGDDPLTVPRLQFVYDSHIAPKLEAWQEVRASRRNGRTMVPVPASSSSRSANTPKRDSVDKKFSDDDEDDDSSTPIELRELVASEVAEWNNTGTSTAHNDNTLRHRRTRTSTVLDEVSTVINMPPARCADIV